MIALTIFSDVVILSYFYVRFYHIYIFFDLVAGTWFIWCTFMMYLTDYDYDVHDYDVHDYDVRDYDVPYCVHTHCLISFHCLTTC